ncbi:MAG: hypothetical protein ACXAD7_11355 [Candidatus Kariarchaeaceae archaeon]
MKVLHVKGKETEEHKDEAGTYKFLDGDVYVIDNDLEIYIWIGKDCGVDEKTVGAWIANKIDNEERGGEPKVTTVLQGEEPEEFKNLLTFEVLDGDTAGFLTHAELDMVEYKLFRVFTKEETMSFDEAFVEEVPLKRDSLNSNDVFILDGNEGIYTWIGSAANREERVEGQKLMQKIDANRQYLPLQYTVYEGEGGKSEQAFYDFLEKASKTEGPVLSVEDQRETEYVPEEALTAEEHKAEADKEFVDTDPSEVRKPEPQTVGDLPPDRAEMPTMSKEDIEGGAERLQEIPTQAEPQRPSIEEEAIKRAQEEEARRIAEEEVARKRAAEEEARKKAEIEEIQRKAAEEEARKKAEEEAAQRKAEEEAAQRKAEEEAAQRKAEEEAAQRKAEEEKLKKKQLKEKPSKRPLQRTNLLVL